MPYDYLIPLLMLSALILYAAMMAVRGSGPRVPMAVRDAFLKAYPHARNIVFEKERRAGRTVFEVDFEDRGAKIEATYATDGSLLQIEQDIKPDALPRVVTEALKKAYPNARLKEAEKIIDADGTVTGYEVEITQDFEIHLDASGRIVKTEAE